MPKKKPQKPPHTHTHTHTHSYMHERRTRSNEHGAKNRKQTTCNARAKQRVPIERTEPLLRSPNLRNEVKATDANQEEVLTFMFCMVIAKPFVVLITEVWQFMYMCNAFCMRGAADAVGFALRVFVSCLSLACMLPLSLDFFPDCFLFLLLLLLSLSLLLAFFCFLTCNFQHRWRGQTTEGNQKRTCHPPPHGVPFWSLRFRSPCSVFAQRDRTLTVFVPSQLLLLSLSFFLSFFLSCLSCLSC